MSSRWLLAAALPAFSLIALAGESRPVVPVRDEQPFLKKKAVPGSEAVITGGNYDFADNGNITVAKPDEHGNPVLEIQGARIEAERITLNRRTKSAAAEGEVRADIGSVRLLADGIRYDTGLGKLDTGRVRLGTPPLLFEAEKASVDVRNAVDSTTRKKVNTSTATLDRVRIYYNEPDAFVISFSASKMSYDSGTEELRADDIVLRLGAVPVMYLPSWTQDGLDGPPIDPDVQVGSNKRYGPFLRTTTYLTVNKKWEPGLLLDGYGKAGVLIGPALRYDTTKLKPGEPEPYNAMKGKFEFGYAQDHSDRGLDQFGRPIDENRYFIDWRHKQTLDDTVEVTSALHLWSDPYALRDFRKRLYDNNQQPDNFVEVVYPDRDFYASAFVRHDPNDINDINQRLPELRFDMNPREISDTRIYQRANISFAYLREQTSPETPFLPGTTADELSTPRLDAYYGLTRPVAPDSAFSITPVAGARSTTWFDAVNGDPTYSRLAGQVGFDAQATARGRWDYENTVWEINGLRHRMRPVVQYRYLPGATEGADRIPLIDRDAFLTAPPPIDLSQRRDTDQLQDTQILRLGLENLFQTREKDYGSRNLLGLDVYQDLRDTDAPGERTLSDTYIREKITPAHWMDVEVFQRISPYTGGTHEFSTQTSIFDGDRWRLSFGTQHVTDALYLDQYYLAWEYRINSQYGLRARWRYDADTNVLTEQTYGVTQQLGHSWQLEYTLGYNKNARELTGVNFGVRLRLNTF